MRVLFASFLLLFCTFLKAQNTTIVEHQHLTFCGISLNNTATAFADSLMAKGFKTETAPPQLPINKTNTILSGRFESIPCIVEIGKNTNEQVDTVRIFFTNVNNPLRSYRILTNIYRTRYGNPIFENYYETHLLPHDAQPQLATDPFVTTFSANGGTVQFSLQYNSRQYEYIYTLLLINTKNAQPVLSNTDDVIVW